MRYNLCRDQACYHMMLLITQATLELTNISAVSRQLRLVPLKSAFFKLTPSACPTADGVVAPGLHASYTISFTPDSLANYQTDLKVNHNTHSDIARVYDRERVSNVGILYIRCMRRVT